MSIRHKRKLISSLIDIMPCFMGKGGQLGKVGGMILRLNEEDRTALKNLKSSDIAMIPKWLEKKK